MADIKSLLIELEKSRQADDELMARAIAALREHDDCIEELVELDRYRSITRQAHSSFIVEAAGILKDRRDIDQLPSIEDLLFARVPAPALHQ